MRARAALLNSVVFTPGAWGGGDAVPTPDTDFDFRTAGALVDLPAGSTFTRASGATRIDHRGLLAEVGANAIRQTYDPALVYNVISNPWGAGITPGGNINQAALGWSVLNNAGAGLSYTAAGSGVEGGTPYVDVRISGTATNSQWPSIIPLIGRMPSGVGEEWSYEVRIARVAGEWPAALTMTPTVGIAPANSANTGLTGVSIALPLTGPHAGSINDPEALVRLNLPATPAGTASVVPAFGIRSVGTGMVFDVTLRFGFPVFNRGDYLLDTVPLPELSRLVNGVPQYGAQGLLLEEAATNRVLNAGIEGAIGTTPVNYTGDWVDGQSVNVSDELKFAARNVMKCVRGTGSTSILVSSTTPTPDGAREAWSVYLYIPAAQAPGVSAITFRADNAAFNTDNVSADLSVVDRWQRIGCTISPIGNVASAELRITATAGTVFYVAGMQCETAGRSSLALPPVGQTVAATRARDACALPVGLLGWPEGTCAFNMAPACSPIPQGGFGSPVSTLAILNASAFFQDMSIRHGSAGRVFSSLGTDQSPPIANPILVPFVFNEVAVRWASGVGRRDAFGGTLGAENSVTWNNAPVDGVRLSSETTAGRGVPGIWRRARFWSVALNDKQMQKATAA